MSETAGSRTPAPAPSGKLGAAQPQAQLPSEVVTSREQQPVISPAPGTPGVLWRSPEEPSLLPQTPETAQPSREDLFFQGQPTTLGALQILIGLLHISGGGILAAAPKFVDFPTPYWYLLAGGALFLITGAATLIATANCTVPRMKVSTGANLVSLLCASLGICAFTVELTASSRDSRGTDFLLLVSQAPQKSLLVLLLLSSVLGLGITSLTTFLGFRATFCYLWSVRSPRDRTGAPSPCPQSLDGYVDPAEDVSVATAALPESPAQQVQHPQPLPEPKAPALPGS